jgi:quinohemoprotein ethanol dehydrogenase
VFVGVAAGHGCPVAPGKRRDLAVYTAEAVMMLLVGGLVAAGVFVGWIIGHYATPGHTKTVTVAAGQTAVQKQAAIVAAPAFSAADLARDPVENWPTNGGSTLNQRYSPLKQIDTGNISQVKGVWLTHLDGSALAAKYSGESQPLEFDGVIYVPTGQDDVFALSADTGKIIWKYTGNLDQTISTVCCGWESRGVALGEGNVYLGRIDGSVVALNQKTGKQVWKTTIEPWQKGYSITAAPLYVDGMVISGISGGEFGIRGRLTALDAKTGKVKWRFYTTAPGSWGGNAYLHGGAPVWQTPSVDPTLGLLYFTTGNANPDNDGSKRPGKNLYAASFVALDLHTGKLKWYYQMVHHDIWDYDAPSPTVLFDATIGGKTVHGIGEAEKTGWLYLLDRATGKPLFPTPEKPVPQNANQKTYPTQPFPSYAPFVPHSLSNTQYTQLVKQVQAAAKGKKHVTVLRAKGIYTPYWKTPTALTPGPQGGTNWQPSSYNPNTHMFYVCAQSGPTANTAETAAPAKQKSAAAQDTIGSTLTIGGGFGSNVGTFTAIDATTGKIVWQKRWPESCYAGSTTTKGNLVFIGRSDGRLQAYNARNGKLLWNWQMGAGANDAPTIFQRNNKEYIAFYAAGNALAASPHGDNLWLLGLNGTMKPAAAPGTGQGIQHAGAGKGNANNNGTAAGDANAGKTIFAANCSTCHGASGHGGNGGPDLTSIPSAKQLTVVTGQVSNGGGGMPPFKGTLTRKQIADVATYVVKSITHGSTSK